MCSDIGVAPRMNSETFGINERRIDGLTRQDLVPGRIRSQSPTNLMEDV